MKNPPILVAVIGFFGALAGFGYLFFGLRVLGFDWFGALGDLPAVEHVGLWGWLAVATGIVWILAALGLWSLQPWARLFAMLIAGFALFEAVLAFFSAPGSGIGFGMAIMPALILWYLSTNEVKAAFEEDVPAEPVPSAAPAAFAAAVPVATRAPEPPAAPVAAAVAPVAAAAAVTPAAPVAPATPAAPVAPAATPAVGSGGSTKLVDIEGIGSSQAATLAAAGIVTTDDLLRAASRRIDRDRIAAATGISAGQLLEWVNKADLMRLPGVGPEYSDLLEAAGVDSPAELAQRNPANLATTFQEVVAARPDIVRRVPGEAEVAGWIEEAKRLDKVVEH